MNQQGGIAGSKHTGTARDVATVLVASYARSHAMPAVRLSSARALVRECLDFAATSAKACPARSAERMSREFMREYVARLSSSMPSSSWRLEVMRWLVDEPAFFDGALSGCRPNR